MALVCSVKNERGSWELIVTAAAVFFFRASTSKIKVEENNATLGGCLDTFAKIWIVRMFSPSPPLIANPLEIISSGDSLRRLNPHGAAAGLAFFTLLTNYYYTALHTLVILKVTSKTLWHILSFFLSLSLVFFFFLQEYTLQVGSSLPSNYIILCELNSNVSLSLTVIHPVFPLLFINHAIGARLYIVRCIVTRNRVIIRDEFISLEAFKERLWTAARSRIAKCFFFCLVFFSSEFEFEDR